MNLRESESTTCSPFLRFPTAVTSLTIEPLPDMMDVLKLRVVQMANLLPIEDNQAMLHTTGAGADTAEQNSHDTGSELFQSDSCGNALIDQPLLSVTGAQSYINYNDGDGYTSLFKAACNGMLPL